MNRPLTTIIVPCYNYAHFLGHTLENIRTQQFADWECIIVDDGSTDDTDKVTAAFIQIDERFRYIRQDNKGLAAARNAGIHRARGAYIQFLDSDDFIHPSKLDKQVAILEADNKIDITYGRSLFFHTSEPTKYYPFRDISRRRKSRQLQTSGAGRVILKKLLVNNIMEVSCALLRKRLVDQVGDFDESYKSYEDWHYWIRCALNNAYFDYSPVEGTETYIRTGHQSMMSNKKKLTLYGIRIRKYLYRHIDPSMRVYNFGRLLKLYARKTFKIY